MELFFQILIALLALFGVFATLMPTMPGIPYMFMLAVVYGFINRFESFTWQHIGLLAVIVILSVIVDYFSGVLGAKYGGASKRSLRLGFISLILGTVLAPPLGGFLGLFLAILLSELLSVKHYVQAFRAASFSLGGALIGVFVNFSLAVIFYILFLIFLF